MGAAIAGVIALFAMGLGYLSFTTWRITPVIMVVLITCAAGVFFYLAARTLKTHEAWRKVAIEQQLEIERLEAEVRKIKEGDEAQGKVLSQGIRQAQQEFYRLAVDRGGVYRQVQLEKIDAQTGAVTVGVDRENHGISAKEVLFAFDEDSITQGGRFVGEFQVAAAPGMSKSIDLKPNMPMSAEELRLLAQNKGPWSLYMMMPIDDPNVLGKMDDNERRALLAKLPKPAQDAYLDPNRQLIDYEVELHEFKLKVPLLTESIRRAKEDIDRIVKEQGQAATQIKYRETEKANLQADLVNFQSERDAVAKYGQALVAQLQEVKNQVRGLFFANKNLAEELTQLQLKAAEYVNRRAGVAQASAPGNAAAR